jgi:hypothetical protein
VSQTQESRASLPRKRENRRRIANEGALEDVQPNERVSAPGNLRTEGPETKQQAASLALSARPRAGLAAQRGL